ncbi:DJ-1/PfpI family protein [Amycolatopsis anabasis]|uniref:DJ-1/PfpI family protein n=1 Tax=Amycolatopsis anabasis TaxID=1840409 RepID=UPI002483C86E|nr:DJ-1/PfpI family protein [Amycolatopsis anabasis]
MRIDIVAFPGNDDLDVFGPLRVLRGAADRGADFEVRLVTREEPAPLVSSTGLRFEPDARYRPGADVLVVPGGGWGSRAAAGAWGEVRRGDWLPLLERARAATPILAGCAPAPCCSRTPVWSPAGGRTRIIPPSPNSPNWAPRWCPNGSSTTAT